MWTGKGVKKTRRKRWVIRVDEGTNRAGDGARDIKMVETTGNMNINPQLQNSMQFRLYRINEIKYYFIVEINEREKWVNDLINML